MVEVLHGSAPWINSMDRLHESASWIGSVDRLRGSAPWINSLDRFRGSTPWIGSMDQLHGTVLFAPLSWLPRCPFAPWSLCSADPLIVPSVAYSPLQFPIYPCDYPFAPLTAPLLLWLPLRVSMSPFYCPSARSRKKITFFLKILSFSNLHQVFLTLLPAIWRTPDETVVLIYFMLRE